MKHFVLNEAERCKVTPGAVEMRISRGQYPGLTVIRKTKRTVYVVLPTPEPITNPPTRKW